MKGLEVPCKLAAELELGGPGLVVLTLGSQPLGSKHLPEAAAVALPQRSDQGLEIKQVVWVSPATWPHASYEISSQKRKKKKRRNKVKCCNFLFVCLAFFSGKHRPYFVAPVLV